MRPPPFPPTKIEPLRRDTIRRFMTAGWRYLQPSRKYCERSRQNRLTLSTIVQAAWSLLLGRYSGSSDIIFGVTMSGRASALNGIESMVGLFINTLPLRTRLAQNSTVVDWLHTLQQQQQELQKYEYCSL